MTSGKHHEHPIVRFQRFILIDGKHWWWTGHHDKDGYGRFFLYGKRMTAHRASVILFKDADPNDDTWDADHVHCKYRDCVSPWHVFQTDRGLNRSQKEHRGGSSKKTTPTKQMRGL